MRKHMLNDAMMILDFRRRDGRGPLGGGSGLVARGGGGRRRHDALGPQCEEAGCSLGRKLKTGTFPLWGWKGKMYSSSSVVTGGVLH